MSPKISSRSATSLCTLRRALLPDFSMSYIYVGSQLWHCHLAHCYATAQMLLILAVLRIALVATIHTAHVLNLTVQPNEASDALVYMLSTLFIHWSYSFHALEGTGFGIFPTLRLHAALIQPLTACAIHQLTTAPHASFYYSPTGWLYITCAGQTHSSTGLLTTICSTAALLLPQPCLLHNMLRCSSCLLQSCEQRHALALPCSAYANSVAATLLGILSLAAVLLSVTAVPLSKIFHCGATSSAANWRS